MAQVGMCKLSRGQRALKRLMAGAGPVSTKDSGPAGLS